MLDKKPRPKYYGVWMMGLFETHVFITMPNYKSLTAKEVVKYFKHNRLFR